MSENHNDLSNADSVSKSKGASIPTWFWVASGIALLWNLLGLMAFVAQIMMVGSETAMAALPPEQQELYKAMPSWVNIAFAVAVIAGTIGSVGLLLRAKWAFPVFVLSLLGVLGQQAYMFFLSDTFNVMGMGAVVFPLIVLVIAILLILFAKSSISKRWIR